MSLQASFIVPHPPLIVPEVGKGEEKKIDKTTKAYEEIAKEISDLKPETIIISSPHAPFYADGFWIYNKEKISGNLKKFGAKAISFDEDIDLEFINEIHSLTNLQDFPVVLSDFDEELDHASIVPLYFIRKYYPKCKIVIIGLSSLPLIEHYKLGILIRKAIDNLGKNVVYVASGDLSHKLQEYGPYGFCVDGPVYDERIMKDCSEGNFYNLLEYKSSFLESAAECGHRSFTIMAGLWDGYSVKSKCYSHEDITGVGYGICSFYPAFKDKKREFLDFYYMNNIAVNPKSEYTKLAYEAIDYSLKNKKYLNIPNEIDSDLLTKKAGVFVSIHEFDCLRGCIGTISPVYSSIAEEIIHNAVSAAFDDPRFSPIKAHEYSYLDISIDVLSEAVDVSDLNELDPKVYGIIVYNNSKSGLLLPDLDGVEDVYTQISIAKRKAGIYDDNFKIKKFTVTRYY